MQRAKLTLETFMDLPEDEEGDVVSLSIRDWQEHYFNFNDMATYPQIVSVELVEASDNGKN